MKGYDINIYLSTEGTLTVTVESPKYKNLKIEGFIPDFGMLIEFKNDLMEFVSEITDEDV